MGVDLAACTEESVGTGWGKTHRPCCCNGGPGWGCCNVVRGPRC